MYIDRRAFDESFVTFLWVLFRGVAEETGTNRSANEIVVTSGGEDVMFIPRDDTISKRMEQELIGPYLSIMPSSCFLTS